jgi:hypothetical protein
MAQGNTLTTYEGLLKEWYTSKPVEDVTFVKNPLLALLPKSENVTGVSFQQPVIYGQGQGTAAMQNFATAQSMGQLTGTNNVQFTITRAKSMSSASMDLETYLSSRGDRGSFMAAMTQISDGLLENNAVDFSRQLFGTGSGSRGQVGNSSFATNQLTLTVPDNSVFFEVGMQLDVAAAEFTGSTRAYGTAGHGLYVVAVDYEQNIISVGTSPSPGGTACNLNDSANGIPAIAQNDFIFRTGDRLSAGATSGLALVGLAGWIPYGGPASNDSFWGVNRSVSPQRLAGLSLDGTTYPLLEECLVDAAIKVARLGGDLDTFVMPFSKFGQLEKSEMARSIIIQGKNSLGVETPQLAFSGLEFLGPNGRIKIVADRSCPANRIYGLNMSSWSINSLKKHINIFNEDGNVWLRQATDGGLEIRSWSMANLANSKPLSNIVINQNP